MPLQLITRRPFTECPFAWSTTISGISSGSGTVGDRQCRGLNVKGYDMRFRACESTGNTLIWVGRCFVAPAPLCFEAAEGSNACDVSTVVDVPSFTVSIPMSKNSFGAVYTKGTAAGANTGGALTDTTVTMTFAGGKSDAYTLGQQDDIFARQKRDDIREFLVAQSDFNEVFYGTETEQGLIYSYGGGTINGCPELMARFTPEIVGSTPNGNNIYATYDWLIGGAYVYVSFTIAPVLAVENYLYKMSANPYNFVDDVAECERTVTATLIGSGTLHAGYGKGTAPTDSPSYVTGFPPSSIQITTKFNDDRNGLEGVVGADVGDRGNATWRLEYDIEQTLWTLHSFERIENPIYTLVDADPCTGLEKILTRVAGSGGNGCEVSPDTVTITRGCRDDFSYRPRDERIRSSRECARTSRNKGCNCKDLPIDERFRSLSKCQSTASPGCEDYGDDFACFYPKNQLTCGVCGNKEIPCTYEALFGGGIVGKTGLCDIIYDETDIAASTVTMRQKCRFTNPCEWVAIGPTGNPIDGVVGKNPASVICSDTPACSSNCTWEKITVSADAEAGNVLAVYGVSWELHVRAIGTTLKYNHPSFGVLIYTASEDEPWLCDNVNTLYLTSRGDLPDGVMPESICIRPRYSGCGGDVKYDIKSDDYAEVEDQIACCDPACGSIGPIPIRIMCCNQLEQCETTFVAQTTLLGIEDPAGPSYLGSCTLHGVLWTGVHYCDGNRWLADWYCGSPRVFFTTTVHTHDCCPLTISVEPFPENFGGVTCCPQADCTCNLRDEVTLSFTIVEPGAATASNCGPNPADCSDDGFDSPISIVLTPEVANRNRYVGRSCRLGGEDFVFALTCGHDGINDVDGLVGDWQLEIIPPGAFSTCLNTPALRFSEFQQNQVSSPALLLEFDDYFCGDDHEDVDCRVFANITITG